MRKFYIRCLLYSVPLLLIIMAVFLVDPYYLFTGNDKFDEGKYNIGYSFDQGRRYKIFTFWNNPTDNIILGASEINIINEHNIPEYGWHSLSYGGAPLQESLNMYWVAQERNQIKKVIIAPEFIKYYIAISSTTGDPYYVYFNWETSQSAKALDIYNNKLDYFVDKYTLKATWLCLANRFGLESDRGKPQGSKSEFWQYQMDYANEQYTGMIFPDKKKEVLDLFSAIKEDADKNGTEVMIVIPIQHTDLIKAEFQEGVFDTYKEYISFLSDTFGGIYYWAYTEGLSENEDLFSDPFHFTDADYYLKGLFGKEKMMPLTTSQVNEVLECVRKELIDE